MVVPAIEPPTKQGGHGAELIHLAGDAAPGAWLEPCMGTERSAEGLWSSVLDRPKFHLHAAVGGKLPRAGWHEVTVRLRCADGPRPDPVFRAVYVDGGCDVRLPVLAAGEGSYRSVVLFTHELASLELLPGCDKREFALEAVELRRLPRSSVLRELLFSTRGLPAVSNCARFVVDTLKSGLAVAVSTAYRRYLGLKVQDAGLGHADWADSFDSFDDHQLLSLRRRLAKLGEFSPKISLIVPAYQTSLPLLQRCIDSVRAQVYENWQLCMVDDASPDPGVYALLLENAARDPRIVVARRDQNGHISRTSNTALELAAGEYIGLLDHDDELRPHALAEVVLALAENPDAGLLYSDEDKLDARGKRFDPYFKPDFDIDLLRSQNYFCHFTVIEAALLRAVGGFQVGFEGSQDHDLFLRCVELLNPRQVVHIPRILYHWRAIEGSTALSRDAKDYASSAGVRAVNAHLQRCHPQAVAEELNHGHYRVRWPLPIPMPTVSLIIPTRDRPELLRTCVASLLGSSTYPDIELLLVDNQSTDAEALALLQELSLDPRVRVLRYDAPFNYSAINNWAVRQARGQLLALVNNDIEVITADWLEEMVSQAIRPEIGAVGAMLYYPDNTIQHAGVILGIHGVAAHLYCGMPRGYPGHGGRALVAQTLSAVTAACLVVRREVFDQVGGLDEELQVAFNDIDFCLRVGQAGYRNLWTPFAELYHHESASRGKEDTDEKKARFLGEVQFMQRRWGGGLLMDPAYNPNLSLGSLCCEPAVPPRFSDAER